MGFGQGAGLSNRQLGETVGFESVGLTAAQLPAHAHFYMPLPGDSNADGKVDAADYVVWRKNVGTNNALPHDLIGGTIDDDQYNQWKTNYGKTAAGSGTAFDSTTVPEPGTIMLFVAAAIGTAWTRHRR